MKNPIGRTSDNKSPADSNNFKHPAQQNLPKPNHHKRNVHKDKKDCSKQAPTGKLCDYHNSKWHDMSECKALNTFLEKLLTSDLSDITLVESYPIESTLLSLTLTTPTTSTIVNEEEREHLFHS